MNTPHTALSERNHPVNTHQPEQLRKAERVLRLIWVIAGGAILFSMLTVTPLVQRVTEAKWDWTAPILPLVVDAAVIIVVRMDSEVSRLGAKAGGWATALRWMTGLFTLGLNIGDSALKGDLVGVLVHAVAPLLLIATSEAIPRYRRTVTLGLDRIAREQADEQRRREQSAAAERERREQQQSVREQQERAAREQAEQRREQLERERLEQEQRAVREQREHDARMAREAREYQARLEQEKQDRAEAARQAELDRQMQVELAQIAAAERREQAERAELARREQQAQQEKERRAAVREQSQRSEREQSDQAAEPVREHRPLHAVNAPRQAAANTPRETSVNTDKVSEATALEMIRDAVNTGQPGVRALARQTGWSPAWVSARVADLRSDDAPADAQEVSA
jgi:hypothetical protein